MTDAGSIPKEAWFSFAEYQRRLATVRMRMRDGELDALVIFSPASCFYLTGHHSVDSWEFRATVITHDRDPVLLLYQFERGRFMASSWLSEAVYYDAGDDPTVSLLELMRRMKLDSTCIGIDSTRGCVEISSLTERLPRAKIQSRTQIIDDLRMIKSEEELACICKAAEYTRLGMNAARESIVEGCTDNEIVLAAQAAMLRAGSHHPAMPPTVAVGGRSGIAHSEHTGAIVKHRDAVFVELSGCYRHYSAPLMYTMVVGGPTPSWRDLRRTADAVAAVILETSKPGVPARVVADAARAAMRSIEDRVQFHYNFGYSVGISFPPHWLEESGFYIKENNPRPLRPGMVFHCALTMRVLGKLAAGTSQTIQITDSGARALTQNKPFEA